MDVTMKDLCEQLSKTERERDAALARCRAMEYALEGTCWMCTEAEPYREDRPFGAMTCRHMRERGIVAVGGRRECVHWRFDEARFAKESRLRLS